LLPLTARLREARHRDRDGIDAACDRNFGTLLGVDGDDIG